MRKFVEKEYYFMTYEQLSWKSENLKPRGSLCTLPFISFLRTSSHQITLERSCSKILQNSVEDKQGGLILVAVHRPSYLQKLNFAGCCPCNFEVSTSRNIFNWWLYFPFHLLSFSKFIQNYYFCSAFVATSHILRNICC